MTAAPTKQLTAKDQARAGAAFERARREMAKRYLHEFVMQAWHVVEPDETFRDNFHIKGICLHLQAISEGRLGDTIFNVPPGTMKSLLVNVFWPAWEWANRPHKRFMHASYAEALSMRDAVKCRYLLTSDWYQQRWPIALKDDENAKGKFVNDKLGFRMVGSVGGKGTGEHPDYLVVDDPHNVIQMESEAERQSVVEWLDSVIATRGVSRGVRRVLVMQRLHSLDASGHLLAKGTWNHICLPMRYEAPEQDPKTGRMIARMERTPIGWNDPRKKDGELLWPELYPEGRVATMEVNMGQYHAAGQLQQRPVPRGGGKFKRAWFVVLEALPRLQQVVRYWDKAGTERKATDTRGARTAGVLMASYIDPAEVKATHRVKYIFLDAQAHAVEAAEREAIIKQQAAVDRATYGTVTTWVEQEPGSGGLESAQATVANLAGFHCMIERVTGSKEVRADPLASQASVGKVMVLAGPWNGMLLAELELFPMGARKDLVDSGGGAFNKLFQPVGFVSADWVPATAPETALPPPERLVFEPL